MARCMDEHEISVRLGASHWLIPYCIYSSRPGGPTYIQLSRNDPNQKHSWSHPRPDCQHGTSSFLVFTSRGVAAGHLPKKQNVFFVRLVPCCILPVCSGLISVPRGRKGARCPLDSFAPHVVFELLMVSDRFCRLCQSSR